MFRIILIIIFLLIVSCDEEYIPDSTFEPMIEVDTSYSTDAFFKTDSVWFHYLTFEDENIGYAVGGFNRPKIDEDTTDNIDYAPTPIAVIYKTSDGGNSWNKLNKLDFPSSFLILDIYSENEWYAAGQRAIHKSTDKGLS